MTDTLVAIITYERLHSLKILLEQINKSTTDFDLIVVDDGSEDETPHYLNKYFKDLGLVWFQSHKTNRGVSAAKNTALRYAYKTKIGGEPKYEYIFILEDDVRIKRDGWIDIYRKAMKETPIKHFNFLPEEILPARLYPKPRADSPYIYGKVLDSTEHEGFTIDYWSDIGGTMMCLTRDALVHVGGFRGSFDGRGFNHVEYSYRVSKAGYTTRPPTFDGDLGWAHVRESTEYLYIDWLQKPTHRDFSRPDDEEVQRRLQYNWKLFQKSLELKHNQLFCGDFLTGGEVVNKVSSYYKTRLLEEESTTQSRENDTEQEETVQEKA